MLERKAIEVRSERSSRKEPFSDKEVRDLLGRVSRVIVCKGRKSTVIDASKARPADLRGPSGNYRAPMLRRGKTLLVGFHAETLEDLL